MHCKCHKYQYERQLTICVSFLDINLILMAATSRQDNMNVLFKGLAH